MNHRRANFWGWKHISELMTFRSRFDIRRKFGKPIVVAPPIETTGADMLKFEGTRREIYDYYFGQEIPAYLTLERAAKALVSFLNYRGRRGKI